MWEGVIAGAETTAEEAVTLHRDLSGLSILGYQSEVLRSALTLGGSLWLIDFSGRGSGTIAHDGVVALQSLATIVFPKNNMLALRLCTKFSSLRFIHYRSSMVTSVAGVLSMFWIGRNSFLWHWEECIWHLVPSISSR